jgi:hypothetical protein
MLYTLALIAVSGIAACSVFLAVAKRSAPITPDEAKVMWTMHKQGSGCNHRKWQFIKRNKNKIIGFKCACGYQYTQKRPLLAITPNNSIECPRYS